MAVVSLDPYDVEDRQLRGIVKRFAHQMETRLAMKYYQAGDGKVQLQSHIKRARIAVQSFLDDTE